MSVPGTPGGQYVAMGLEHNEKGRGRWDQQTHMLMTQKRFRKMERSVADAPAPVRYGDPAADVGIVTWGSTTGTAIEALDRLARAGVRLTCWCRAWSTRYRTTSWRTSWPKSDRHRTGGELQRSVCQPPAHPIPPPNPPRQRLSWTAHEGGFPCGPDQRHHRSSAQRRGRIGCASACTRRGGTACLVGQSRAVGRNAGNAARTSTRATRSLRGVPAAATSACFNSVYRALRTQGIPPHQVVCVSGIGCSSRIPYFINAYGFHGIHAARCPLPPGYGWLDPT